jgi:hypothetical protein
VLGEIWEEVSLQRQARVFGGRSMIMGQLLSRPVDVVGEGESMWKVQMGAGRGRGVVEPVDHDGCYV